LSAACLSLHLIGVEGSIMQLSKDLRNIAYAPKWRRFGGILRKFV
jgi:hypothetical protein